MNEPPPVRKQNNATLVILSVILGVTLIIAVLLFRKTNILRSQVSQLQTQLDDATHRQHPVDWYATHSRPLPIRATYRKALLGPGYVLVLQNTSSESLSLVVKLESPTFQRQKTFDVVVDRMRVAELGHLEGWRLASGDLIEISHEGFEPIHLRLQ